MIVTYKILENIRKQLDQEMAEFLSHWPNSEMLMDLDVQDFGQAWRTVHECLKEIQEDPDGNDYVNKLAWWSVKSLTYELLKRDYGKMKITNN